MRKIKRVGFVIKPHAPDVKKALEELSRYFSQKEIECVLEEAAAKKLGRTGTIARERIPSKVDLVVVLGGDGTLLSIAHLAAQKKVPVMGVNLGSLGFLTDVPRSEMFLSLDAYLDG